MADSDTSSDISERLAAAHPVPLRLRLEAVQRSFGLPIEKELLGLKDSTTEDAIKTYLKDVFEQHGGDLLEKDDLGRNTRITGSQTKNVYEFGEDGTIYAVVEVDGKLVRGGKVGSLLDGISQTDEKTLPHEATLALLSRFHHREELQQNGAMVERQSKALQERKTNIALLLDTLSRPDLKDRLELELRKNGLDRPKFKESEVYKELKGAAKDSGEFDAYILLILQNTDAMNDIGYDSEAGASDYYKIDSIFNLLHFMRTGENYDPKAQADLRAGVAVRDNILSHGAYPILKLMKGGEHIRIEALYDEKVPGQKESILAAFPGQTEISREAVYAYVKGEFENRAIKTLSNKEDISGMSAEERAEVLKGVSHAMAEGRFNPYEEDVRLTFKAMGATPGKFDNLLQQKIAEMRASGTIPPGGFFVNNLDNADIQKMLQIGLPKMSDATLDRLIKDTHEGSRDFFESDRIKLLAKLNDVTPANFDRLAHDEKSLIMGAISRDAHVDLVVGIENYDQTIRNYYEKYMGNYTWWRAGAVDGSTQGTWNSDYGTLNQTQLMHTYMRYNWTDLKDDFGQNGDMFFNITGNRLNYSLTYDEAAARLTPAQLQKLDAGIADLNNPSMYMYLMELRPGENDGAPGYYRELRVNKYIPTIQRIEFEKQQAAAGTTDADAAAKTAAKLEAAKAAAAAGTGADSADANGVPFAPVVDPKTLEATGLAAESASGGMKNFAATALAGSKLRNHFKSSTAMTSAAEIASDIPIKPQLALPHLDEFGVPIRPAASSPQLALPHLDEFGVPIRPAASSPQLALPHLTDIAEEVFKPLAETVQPSTLTTITENIVDGVDLTLYPEADDVKPTIRMEKPDLTLYPDVDDIARASETTADAFQQAATFSETVVETTEDALKIAGGAENAAAAAAKTAAAAETALETAGKGASALKAFRSIPGIGIGATVLLGGVSYDLAAAEIGKIKEDKIPTLVAAGLLKKDNVEALGSTYNWHKAQSVVDLSVFLGEWFKTMPDYYKAVKGVDPVTADLVKPGFLSSMIASAWDKYMGNGDILDTENEIKKAKKIWSEENLPNLYNNIIADTGLPKTIPVKFTDKDTVEDVPFGKAIRDPAIEKSYRETYTTPQQQQALDHLVKLNAMAVRAHELIGDTEDVVADAKTAPANTPAKPPEIS